MKSTSIVFWNLVRYSDESTLHINDAVDLATPGVEGVVNNLGAANLEPFAIIGPDMGNTAWI